MTGTRWSCSGPKGLYCPPGDFYIDPWRPVERAVITHAHADHARRGHTKYLAAAAAEHVLRTRLGDIALQTLAYGERAGDRRRARVAAPGGARARFGAGTRRARRRRVGGVGRLQSWAPTAPARAFEPQRCDTFITESTFGLPIYRWADAAAVFADIDAWWAANAAAGRASVLFCYAFGKAQRILAGVDSSIGPIVVHGAVEPLNAAYRASGVVLPVTRRVTEIAKDELPARARARAAERAGSPWLRRFGDYSDAFASGWMQLRGARRRRALDRGFVLSDHADWPGLQSAIAATGAAQVIVTHGYVPVMVRWLREQGLAAEAFATEYGDAVEEAAEAASAAADAGESS